MVRKRRRWAVVVACLPALLVTPPAVAATGSPGELVSGTVVQVATEVSDVPTDPEDNNGAPVDPVGAPQTTVPHDGAAQVSGTIVHVDLGADGTAVLVQTGTELVRVEGDGVEDLEPDTQVSLTVTADASRSDAVKVVDTVVEAPVADATTTAHHIKVALVAPKGTVPADFTVADVPGMVKGASDYWSKQTDGRVSFTVDSVADWTRSSYSCADFRSIWSDAQNATGFRGDPGEHLLVLVPKAAYNTGGCSYGKATIGADATSGGALIVADTIPALISHELGHNLGLDHANAIYSSAADSTSASNPNAWASGSNFVEYGDIQDVMGWSGTTVGTSSLNAVHRDQMRIFDDEIQDVSTSGDVVIEQTGAAGRGNKVVKVVNGSATYYLEYRTSVGADVTTFNDWRSPAAGVRVLRADLNNPGYQRSVVLDPTPTGSTNDYNQVIPVGKTFDTADNQLHFTVRSTADGSATVNVTFGASIAAPVTVPGAPTITEALAAAPDYVTLRWTAASDGNGTLKGYTVTPYLDGAAVTARTQTLSSTATMTAFSDLAAGVYTFGVKAQNEKGFGAEARSAPITVIAPVVEVPDVISVTATGVADRSAWATFTATAPAPGNRTLGYVVTAYRNGVAGKPAQVSLTANRAMVTGLVNGGSYTLGIRARTSTGYGPETMTSSLVPITTPALVSGLTARLVSEDRGKLTWTVPANGGSALTGYTITPTRNGVASTPISISTTDLEVLRVGAAGPITVAADVDVEPGTTWTYTVVATNGAGEGKASARATLKVPALKAPSAVGTVKAALTYQNLALTWAAPAPGSRPIEGYTVSVRKNGGAPQETKVTTTTTTLEVDAASTYAVTVTARSELGAAPASRPVTVKVPAMTAPRVVTGLRGVLSGSTYTLTWGQPIDGNSPLQGYTVTQYADGVPVSTRQIDPTTRTASYTLTANVGYSFTVAASNGVGTTTSSRTTAVKVRG